MPEHVHIVLMPTEVAGLSKILMNLKRHSAWLLNRRLHRKGGFWLDDFFDHWARDRKQVAESIEYLHNNPVRRGLVSKPEEYPYSSYLAWEQPENSRYQVDRELFW
jgi:putative transposase